MPAAPGPDRSPPRWAAAGLIVGPLAFVGAWAVGGALVDGYSPVHDAISRLAADGAPWRPLMTAGFLVYGGAVVVGSRAIAAAGLGLSAAALVVNGLATVAVAATPLDRSGLTDGLHAVAAMVGYVSIIAVPALAVGPLRRHGQRSLAIASAVASAVSATCLVATTVSDADGLLQRLGLGAGDVWLVGAGIALLSGPGALSGLADRGALLRWWTQRGP
ncbi:hypothetical protein BH23ACT2_BH23ACT2_29090 [soil metagenome]